MSGLMHMKYDAFISYKHGADKPVASALQTVLQTLGKPWWRRRTMRIFRDDTTLVPSQSLLKSIEAALTNSRTFVLIASREAATSPWVAEEVAYWITYRDLSSFYIAVTDGELKWNADESDFDWGSNTPLPDILRGRFKDEPLWVDLRPYRGATGNIGKHDKEFVTRAAGIAAGILGRAKEDLLSDELRQQRRNLTWALSAAAALAALAGVAGWQAWEAQKLQTIAENNERKANQSADEATRERKAAQQNSVRAQMQVARLESEKKNPLEALKAAVNSVKAAKASGIDLLALEKDLYEVSSQLPRGLVSAARIQWPEGIKNSTVQNIEFASSEPIVCLLSRQQEADESAVITREHCFSPEGRMLKARPEIRNANAAPAREDQTSDIDISLDGKRLALRHPEKGDIPPIVSVDIAKFGGRLDIETAKAFRCNPQYVVVRSDSDSSAFSIDIKKTAVIPIQGASDLSDFYCAPNSAFLINRPERGALQIVDLSSGELIHESEPLARFGSEGVQPHFGAGGLIFVPGMSGFRSADTLPTLISTAEDWSIDRDEVAEEHAIYESKKEIEFPNWNGLLGHAVGISSDARYAAIVYGSYNSELVLTVWDLRLAGLEKTEQAEQLAEADLAQEVKPDIEARDQFEKLIKQSGTSKPVRCIEENVNGQKLVGVGDDLWIEYDKVSKEIISQRKVRWLFPWQESEEWQEREEFGCGKVYDLAASIKAICPFTFEYGKKGCAFGIAEGAANSVDEAVLAGICGVGYQSDDMWVCVRDPKQESDDTPSVSLINWKIGQGVTSRDPYFSAIFDFGSGIFADFGARGRKDCERVAVAYYNNPRDGGARQPEGAFILDLARGDVGAIHKRHPIFCSVDELVGHLDDLAERFSPPTIVVGEGSIVPQPDTARKD